MFRQSVNSSAIASVGYDAASLILEIEFHETGVYSFYGVPPHIFSGLMNASSKGSYYNDYIRDQYSSK